MKHKAQAKELDYGPMDFALIVETPTDGERIQRDNDDSAKAKAEAQTKQEKLFD